MINNHPLANVSSKGVRLTELGSILVSPKQWTNRHGDLLFSTADDARVIEETTGVTAERSGA
jgi:hypothetical protein